MSAGIREAQRWDGDKSNEEFCFRYVNFEMSVWNPSRDSSKKLDIARLELEESLPMEV